MLMNHMEISHSQNNYVASFDSFKCKFILRNQQLVYPYLEMPQRQDDLLLGHNLLTDSNHEYFAFKTSSRIFSFPSTFGLTTLIKFQVKLNLN